MALKIGPTNTTKRKKTLEKPILPEGFTELLQVTTLQNKINDYGFMVAEAIELDPILNSLETKPKEKLFRDLINLIVTDYNPGRIDFEIAYGEGEKLKVNDKTLMTDIQKLMPKDVDKDTPESIYKALYTIFHEYRLSKVAPGKTYSAAVQALRNVSKSKTPTEAQIEAAVLTLLLTEVVPNCLKRLGVIVEQVEVEDITEKRLKAERDEKAAHAKEMAEGGSRDKKRAKKAPEEIPMEEQQRMFEAMLNQAILESQQAAQQKPGPGFAAAPVFAAVPEIPAELATDEAFALAFHFEQEREVTNRKKQEVLDQELAKQLELGSPRTAAGPSSLP